MEMHSIYDPEFVEYGQVLGDVDPEVTGAIVGALADRTPLPEGVGYVPEDT